MHSHFCKAAGGSEVFATYQAEPTVGCRDEFWPACPHSGKNASPGRSLLGAGHWAWQWGPRPGGWSALQSAKLVKTWKQNVQHVFFFFQIYTHDVKLTAVLVYMDQGLKKQPDKISRDHLFSLGSLGEKGWLDPPSHPGKTLFKHTHLK